MYPDTALPMSASRLFHRHKQAHPAAPAEQEDTRQT